MLKLVPIYIIILKKKIWGVGGDHWSPSPTMAPSMAMTPPPPFGGPLMVLSQDMYILNVFARKLEPKTSRSNCNILDYEFIMRWCAESHIKYLLGKLGLYKGSWEVLIVAWLIILECEAMHSWVVHIRGHLCRERSGIPLTSDEVNKFITHGHTFLF